MQALLDNLTGRGLDPVVCRLFIIDDARAPSKAIQQTFGRHTHADPTVSDLQGPATSSSACRAIWSARRCVEDNAARAGQLMKSPCAPLERVRSPSFNIEREISRARPYLKGALMDVSKLLF